MASRQTNRQKRSATKAKEVHRLLRAPCLELLHAGGFRPKEGSNRWKMLRWIFENEEPQARREIAQRFGKGANAESIGTEIGRMSALGELLTDHWREKLGGFFGVVIG